MTKKELFKQLKKILKNVDKNADVKLLCETEKYYEVDFSKLVVRQESLNMVGEIYFKAKEV